MEGTGREVSDTGTGCGTHFGEVGTANVADVGGKRTPPSWVFAYDNTPVDTSNLEMQAARISEGCESFSSWLASYSYSEVAS